MKIIDKIVLFFVVLTSFAQVYPTPRDQVGNVVRSCGCYLPEIILMDQLMPSIQEDDYEVCSSRL